MRQRHPEMTPPLSLALRRTSNLQNLNSLWKDELTIDTLLGHEANHTITCEELSELLEGTSTTVTDVVVAVVTEGHHVCRAKRRSIDIVAHELVRLTCDERRLPHESTVVVLESTDSCDSCIVHDKGCILSVRTLQCIDELDDILRLRSSYGLSKGTATSLSEKAKRLTVTSTVEECILLGICQSLTKLIDDVIFKTEGIIIEKFFGDLDSYMEFVRIQKDLTEGRIRKLKCAAFLNPCCSRLGRCNIDFVLAGSGNLMAQLTHDVLFIQNIDKTMVIFLRNKVAAIGIDTFLQDVRQVTGVRGMLGFTGTYQGRPISVMGSGMGMPSIGIYSYELFKFYDVDNIIRIGSAGSYTEKAKLFDVVLSTGAVSESNYARVQSGFEGDITLPSQSLNDKLRASAAKQGIPLIEGNIHSSDVFYRQPSDEKPTYWEKLRDERGCLCVEMESFALFANAQVLGKHAACLLTISDSFVAPEITTAEQRQTSFTNMMKVALGAEY